jgi:DNA-binding transcriptional LysR family regulator
MFIPSFIHDFNEKYPANKIKFRFKQNMQTGLVDALLDDKLDMILSGEADMRLESIPLMEQELFLVVSKDHPLASRESVEFAEVGREPFIMLGQESSLRQFLDGHFIKARIRPDVVVEAFECSGALQYVAQNLGVTIIPHTPSVDFLPVKLIKIKTPGFKRQIYLSWRQDRPDTPLFNLVRKFIQERFLLAYDI